MAVGGFESAEFPLRRLFPWLRLLRGIGLALDGRKMILAALGLVLMWAGWEAIAVISGSPPILDLALIEKSETAFLRGSPSLSAAALSVTDPIRIPARPFRDLFSLGQGTGQFLNAAAGALWVLIVWSVVGGAIARIAVVQAATGQRLGIPAALRFATGRCFPLIGTPLVVLGGLAIPAGVCTLMGLLYQLPRPGGELVAGALAFVPLLLGLVMAWLLVGLTAGWPLMVASIAAQGEDTFDALSRSFSYVFQRPVAYILYTVLAWVLGTVGLLIVGLFARLVIHLAAWGLAFGSAGCVDGPVFHAS